MALGVFWVFGVSELSGSGTHGIEDRPMLPTLIGKETDEVAGTVSCWVNVSFRFFGKAKD